MVIFLRPAALVWAAHASWLASLRCNVESASSVSSVAKINGMSTQFCFLTIAYEVQIVSNVYSNLHLRQYWSVNWINDKSLTFLQFRIMTSSCALLPETKKSQHSESGTHQKLFIHLNWCIFTALSANTMTRWPVLVTWLAKMSFSLPLQVIELHLGDGVFTGYRVTSPFLDVAYSQIMCMYPDAMTNITRQILQRPGNNICPDPLKEKKCEATRRQQLGD